MIEDVDIEHAVSQEASRLIGNTLGDWWKDDRRRWCAYCGIPMRVRAGKNIPLPPTKATRDHVIPRKHGGGLTIPACFECNEAKQAISLQEFLLSDHFLDRRRHHHRNQWPIERLWLVASLAALKRSIAISERGRSGHP